MQDTLIPLITTPIDIIEQGIIYDTGLCNDKLFLMYKIIFPNDIKSSQLIHRQYALFFKKLKHNNNIIFYSKYHGVYFQSSYLDYYLIFDYPMYQIDNIYNGDDFYRPKAIYDFFLFLSKLTGEEMANFLLMNDLIFFTEDKELRIVQFGNIDKVSMPQLRKVFENIQGNSLKKGKRI